MRPESTKDESPDRTASSRAVPPRRLLALASLFALAGFGLLYFFSDGVQVLEAAAGISWTRALLPAGATVASYLLMALSYEGIAAATGTPIGVLPMLRITFVSTTVNYLVATGGLSGFAVRMYFFRQHGIPIGRAVTISFVQGLLTNLSLLLFLVIGFYLLVAQESLSGFVLALAAAMLALFSLATLLCVAFMLRPALRRWALSAIADVLHRLAARFLPSRQLPHRARLFDLQENIDRGFDFLLTNWRRMIVPTIYILLDWAATLAVFWACFWSVGLLVSPALITVGFSVAILSSLISIAPGGLGIMESLTTAVCVALGTQVAPTIVALLLFRLAYYALPFAISMVFFGAMLRDASRHSTPP